MFERDLLDDEGEIPRVFRMGVLQRNNSQSSLSKLMSEIDKNDEELHDNEDDNDLAAE